MRLDSHQHFWRYRATEFDWIDDRMAVLRRDFLPVDLEPLRAAAGIDGTIAVQARQSLAETQWLLDLSSRHSWIRGVVGWVDLASRWCGHQLDTFAKDPRLCGVRHVLQAEPADFTLRPGFLHGIAQLTSRRLAYDVLVKAPQLPAAIALCRRFPEQTFVLDHLGKPDARAGAAQEPWAAQLRELAKLPNVACKLSGLVTESDWQGWNAALLRPWFATALDAFGCDRVMFGSDWPVCLCASTYERWSATVDGLLAGTTSTERAAVFGRTAARVYRLRGDFAAPDGRAAIS